MSKMMSKIARWYPETADMTMTQRRDWAMMKARALHITVERIVQVRNDGRRRLLWEGGSANGEVRRVGEFVPVIASIAASIEGRAWTR